MKQRKAIIAAAQMKYFDISRKNNVEKIKRYIRRAKKVGADIICFPESCVHKTETLYFNDTLIREIREECKKNSIWCIITEDLEIKKKKKYNTAMLIDRKGNIKGNYKKINLYGDELLAGSKIKVVKTDFAKIGFAICWDLAFPDLFKKLKKAGAEIIFCPSMWEYEPKAHNERKKEREIKILESLILTRAFENLCFVILCNPVTQSKLLVSYSAIASPHRILKSIVGKEGLIYTKINLNELKKAKKIYNN